MKRSGRNKKYIYNESLPRPSLRNCVEKIWTFETNNRSLGKQNFHLQPDYSSSLIFMNLQDQTRRLVYVSGPNTENIPLLNSPEFSIIGFRFYPLMLNAMLGILPQNTKNTMAELSQFITPELHKKLTEIVEDISDTELLVRRISDYLTQNFVCKNIAECSVSVLINKIINSGGNVKLDAEYSDFTVGKRQFQRNFVKLTGITPKEFCRVVRFQTAARKLVRNNFSHFDTLCETGFYDQSHYYKEFKLFLGMLPSGFENIQSNIFHKNLVK
ncbi:MAG TPA: helix-turn-helix domain-containing protein [Ignavibacteria bacterium]|nr:helix-turn-helix domain-containing protein [Ignavibacteria bacterium]